jgi:hypothetical protein
MDERAGELAKCIYDFVLQQLRGGSGSVPNVEPGEIV